MGILDTIQQALGGLGGQQSAGGGFSIMDALGGLGGQQQQRQQNLPGQMNPFNNMGFLQKMAIGLGGQGAVDATKQRLAPKDIGGAMPWLQQQQPGARNIGSEMPWLPRSQAQFPGEPQGQIARPLPISPYQQTLLNQRNNFGRG